MSNQTTVVQIVIRVPPFMDYGNGKIEDHITYSAEELKYLLNGHVSIDSLRGHGLCCPGKRGYSGLGVLAAISAGSFKVKENVYEEKKSTGKETRYRDRDVPIHPISDGGSKVESRRDRRKRLKKKV